ncbi:MarR family transcriptional regulator [Pacificimonas flava]|uniref:MarR family transcriptional regulator n=2 Tax=Pacificimonas TaxID=1960290 RepID=A0A219B2U6_9SPHN|nr:MULTISPECIES: MarR family transcriptional regulator [Pacificimonas]MBZ6378238.1 MarR family transcriptional regulator [Pacificimonas aurantium]OWV32138.1 MarR family transcriptional regulator [Pacificimonas flava]
MSGVRSGPEELDIENRPDQAEELLRLDRQVCFPLYAASNLINRLYRPVLAELGLTYPQYLTMLVLWERSPRTVGELAAALHLDGGTLTPLLKRLEASGFVTRTRDVEDERRVLIELTAQGRTLKTRAAQVPLTLMEGFEYSEEDADNLRETVQDLVAMLADRSQRRERS